MDEVVESFAATGIDDALDLLAVVTAKTDKASVGQQAAGLEKHPERRFKVSSNPILYISFPSHHDLFRLRLRHISNRNYPMRSLM